MTNSLKLYYDDKCKLCKASVYFIIRNMKIPQDIIYSGSSDEKIAQIMDDENSWVLIDERGKVWTQFSVFQKLINNSPRFKWAYNIISIRVVSYIGNLIYFIIAKNRDKLSKLFR